MSAFTESKDRLVAKAGIAAVDAFEAEVRRVTAQSIAQALVAIAGDGTYSVGKLDADAVRMIAGQIERMY